MKLVFNPSLGRKAPKAMQAAKTNDQRRANIVEYLQKEATEFEALALGIKGNTRLGWIVLDKDDNSKIWISAFFSTKRLAWEGEIDQYPATKENFSDVVEMLKEEIRNGRLDEQIIAESQKRKEALRIIKNRTPEQKEAARKEKAAKAAARKAKSEAKEAA